MSRALVCLLLRVVFVMLLPARVFGQAVPLSQALAEELKFTLSARMTARENKVSADFPPVYADPNLEANARYARDTIWLGNPQAAFSTFDDRLSLLYHEYIHWRHEQEGRYPVGTDSTGNILQWNTGEFYLHVPDSEEVARDLEHFEQAVLPAYGEMTTEDRAGHLARFRRDMEMPRQLPFFYAPSHLAAAELAAYRAQLSGESAGLYALSAHARREIRIRMRQLNGTLARRQAYEQQHQLGPDGHP